MTDDPFVLEPDIWYAVLCNAFNIDEQTGNANLLGVYNQSRFWIPPPESGVAPYAHVDAVLAIALQGGEGQFSAQIDVRDLDDRVYWTRPKGAWTFDLGLGRRSGAILAEQVSVWLTSEGRYFFQVIVTPGHLRFRIPFEVAAAIGPGRRGQSAPDPGTPR